MKSKHLFLPMLALCMSATSSNAATILYAFSGGNIAFAANLGAGSAVTTNDFGSGITASNYTAS